MSHSSPSGPHLWLAVGVLVGFVLSGLLPHTPLHATATDREQDFALATGKVDDQIEAVFMLDFLTGRLTAAVLNPQSHTFSLIYRRDIMPDFKIAQGKAPKFLMVTGDVDLRSSGGSMMGSSAVYVAELSTGNMAAYALEFSRSWLNTPATAEKQFHLLNVGPIRGAAVRGK